MVREVAAPKQAAPLDARSEVRSQDQARGVPPEREASFDRRRRVAPFGLVAVAVGFNLWVLRAEILPVLSLGDGSVHLSMVRWTLERLREGHLPFDGWYPYLGLGSSLFHHYQSLPHVLTGTLSLAIGPERAYFAMQYLLLVSWPVSVYLGARLLGWERWVAGGAALLSPLLASTPLYGYELQSYVWGGWELWSQLWAMWLLPIAFGLTWRTVSGREPTRYAASALVLGLTVACHFLTGYLAFLVLGVWVLIRPSAFRRRLTRATVVGTGAALFASWVLVPALLDARWVSQSAFRQGSELFDSFGAPKVLAWLFTGQLFDAGRPPFVSVLVVIGGAVCIARFRRDERARALLGVMTLSLVLFSGRPTFGPIIGLLPGSDDLLLHRYIMGVHLAGLLLAGVGLAWIGSSVPALLRGLASAVAPATAIAATAAFLFAISAPAWAERWTLARSTAALIHEQRAFDATEGEDVRTLIDIAKANGPGRIYAGLSTGWGIRERLGHVPVFHALLEHDADAIGFVLRTTSLSSDLEVEFDDSSLEHYELFAVRYLLLSDDRRPRVPATLLDRRGGYTLWEVETGGYIDVVDTVPPPIEADRVDLHDRALPFLSSASLEEARYPLVAFSGTPAGEPTLPDDAVAPGAAGAVESEEASPADGEFTAEVVANRRAVVLLRSSFDPRWEVTVDGERVEPYMVAPSFVGGNVPAGRHTVTFRYRSFPRYDVLFAIGALTIVALWTGPRVLARRRSRGKGEERSQALGDRAGGGW